MSVPTLVVVGRTNKGKSSVVATIAGISPGKVLAVGPRPGTTTRAHRYPITIDGQPLIAFVDTPGLEEAPRARAWILERAESAADRPQAVAAFVETFKNGSDFREEVLALEPVVAGGGILYVVDGTQPYRDRFEAEMEVLQWTARPRMALINRIRHDDSAGDVEQHVADWRAALSQYFSTVTEFDAHRAGFAQRVELFRTLAALDEGWRSPMRRVAEALVAQRQEQDADAAAIIADLLAKALSHQATRALSGDEAASRTALYEAFHAHLQRLEDRARRRVEAAYGLGRFEGGPGLEAAPFEADLFAEATWKTFGLSPKALLGTAAVTGGGAGAWIDVHVGGASWGTGALVGSLLGTGAAAWNLGRRVAEVSGGTPWGLRKALSGDRQLTIGPHPSPNFGWVLLGRALQHLRLVRDWSHARPTAEAEGILARLAPPLAGLETPRHIHKLFMRLRKKPTPEVQRALEGALRGLVAGARSAAPGGSPTES